MQAPQIPWIWIAYAAASSSTWSNSFQSVQEGGKKGLFLENHFLPHVHWDGSPRRGARHAIFHSFQWGLKILPKVMVRINPQFHMWELLKMCNTQQDWKFQKAIWSTATNVLNYILWHEWRLPTFGIFKSHMWKKFIYVSNYWESKIIILEALLSWFGAKVWNHSRQMEWLHQSLQKWKIIMRLFCFTCKLSKTILGNLFEWYALFTNPEEKPGHVSIHPMFIKK